MTGHVPSENPPWPNGTSGRSEQDPTFPIASPGKSGGIDSANVRCLVKEEEPRPKLLEGLSENSVAARWSKFYFHIPCFHSLNSTDLQFKHLP